MTGWQRLKLVLSVIYWGFVGVFVWGAGLLKPDDTSGMLWPVLIAAAVVYAIAAAIWWAFAGFSRRA